MKEYLQEKRNELIWSLSDQDYSQQDIADIFGLSKSRVHYVVNAKPAGWKSPWVKRSQIEKVCT